MKRHILIIAAAAVALAACNTNAGNNASAALEPGTQSGIDKSLMDTSVKPGDDFDKYANGAWEKNAVIPADKSNYGMFSVLSDRSEERTKELILNAKGEPGSEERKIAEGVGGYARPMPPSWLERQKVEVAKRVAQADDRGVDHSGWIPASLINLLLFTWSARMVAANCSGEPPRICMPSTSSRETTSGKASARAISWESLATCFRVSGP